MKKYLTKIFILTLVWAISSKLSAQDYTQNVRGTVVDKVSQAPIAGVVVIIADTIAVETDLDGNFKFTNIPVGKYNLIFKYEGYKIMPIQNVAVNSGKEVVLSVPMEEDITVLETVVVGEKLEKNKPINSMSTVSTRVFSVEETQKYAAAVNDPARMASAFAGVVTTNDGNNGISIRGNSPNGLLWRMEGVDIPNPNHFSDVGTAGGGVSILSAQLLSNSDFSTGAFAAEYGNALSGVFDIRLRKGNNEKREYTFQAGFLGLDAAIEGPFKKGYNGSYLVNYRYSTLGLITRMVDLFDAKTLFQDLSYNIYLPTNKYGNISFFGINGLSNQTTEAKSDTNLWNIRFNRANTKFFANTHANGMTYSKTFNKRLHMKSALVYSSTVNGSNIDELNTSFQGHPVYREKYVQNKWTLNTVFNYKVNARNSFRSGFMVNKYAFSLSQKELNDSTKQMLEYVNHSGDAESMQIFSQWQNRLNEKLTLNAGLHYMRFFLNGSQSLEPRASVRYELTSKKAMTFGYGLHSQIQPLGVYFAKVAAVTPNTKMGLSKAHHIVLGYDQSLNSHMRMKLETYYQHLFNIGQGTDVAQNFSVLNENGGNFSKALNNGGSARNYGLELTMEHFMHNNFYFLASASLYDSKYKGTDGHMYNTRFNGNYAFTVTTGKEFKVSERKKRMLGINLKSYYAGGFRRTPMDVAATLQKGDEVYEHDKSFTDQNPAYFRTDLRVSLRRNYKHATTTLALDIQNVTSRKNVGGQYFDEDTKEIKYFYQTPLIPILSYRIEF
ncbi:MAG TPA: TonB-dependent receptor [Cytophagales bacterium]|nr:TonB-dependent receptor [Cytophagales bacterium]